MPNKLTLQGLQQARAEVFDKQKALLDLAAEQNRELTRSEDQQFNTLETEFENLTAQIGDTQAGIAGSTREQLIIARENMLNQPAGTPYRPSGQSAAATQNFPMFQANSGGSFKDYVAKNATTLGVDASGINNDVSLNKLVKAALFGGGRQGLNSHEIKALNEGSGSSGGILIPTQLSLDIIGLALQKMALSQVGIRTIPLPSNNLTLAKLLSLPTASWVAEGGMIDTSEPTFGWIDMKSNKVAALTEITEELLQDAPNIGSMLMDAIATALALEMDRAGLFGNGVGMPLGLYNHSDIATTDAGGKSVSPYATGALYDPWSKAYYSVMNNNYTPTATIYNTSTAGQMDLLRNNNGDLYTPPRSFDSLTKAVSNQIPNDLEYVTGSDTYDNATASFVGDFSNMIMGVGLDIKLEWGYLTNSFQSNKRALRAVARVDYAVTSMNAFNIIKGLVPVGATPVL